MRIAMARTYNKQADTQCRRCAGGSNKLNSNNYPAMQMPHTAATKVSKKTMPFLGR